MVCKCLKLYLNCLYIAKHQILINTRWMNNSPESLYDHRAIFDPARLTLQHPGQVGSRNSARRITFWGHLCSNIHQYLSTRRPRMPCHATRLPWHVTRFPAVSLLGSHSDLHFHITRTPYFHLFNLEIYCNHHEIFF